MRPGKFRFCQRAVSLQNLLLGNTHLPVNREFAAKAADEGEATKYMTAGT
jgi:hypothetical protein